MVLTFGMRDLTGLRFGFLTVLGFSHKNSRRIGHWYCNCDCGGKAVVASNNLTSGNSTTCGCRHGIKIPKVLTQEVLKKFLHYEPETGVFTWLVNIRNAVKGAQAGHSNPYNPYVRIGIGSKTYLAHVLAWFYMTGEWPLEQIDHRDLIKDHNAWENLRLASSTQNHHNTALQARNKHGFKGVVFNRHHKYVARITVDKKPRHLGCFSTAEAAARAYDTAARKHFGEFARTNFGAK